MTYEYDARGNQRFINITDANNTNTRTTEYQYDTLGRQKQIIHPTTRVEKYTYTKAHELKTYTDGKNQVTTNEYDQLGRLKKSTYHDNTEDTYTYDRFSNTTEIVYNTTKSQYEYDTLGRLLTKKDFLLKEDTTPLTIDRMSYDARGLLKNKALSNNLGLLTYTYDKRGLQDTTVLRQPNFEDSDITTLVDRSHNQDGLESRLLYGNGIIHQNQFDARNRVDGFSIAGGETTHHAESYTYDANNNRTENIKNEIVTNYTYDSLDQLKTEGSVSYEYNAWGDRLSQTNGPTLSYTNSGLTNGFGHDANNAVTSYVRDSISFRHTYNARNQLVTKTNETVGSTEQYVYDHVGRRTVTNTEGTTHYVNNGLSVAYELNEAKEVTKAVIDDIAELTLEPDDSYKIQYTHRDTLGSTILVSSQSGEVSTYQYDAFGKTTPGVSNTLATSYQYTNQQNDGDLYYYNGRYYDPAIGRFTQPDLNLRGDVLTMNRFAYVSNNPFKYTDPTGWSKEGSVDHETFVDHLSKTAGVAVGIVEGFLSDVQAAIELSFSQNAYSKYKNAKKY